MAAVSVTTSATTIYTAKGQGARKDNVVITNDSGNDVYLSSASDLTTSTGIKLASGSAIGLELTIPDVVYGIAGSTSEVRVEAWPA